MQTYKILHTYAEKYKYFMIGVYEFMTFMQFLHYHEYAKFHLNLFNSKMPYFFTFELYNLI